MKLINKFFITLMALSLSSAILAFCLDSTILNANFVTAQADKSGVYTDLAKQLPAQLASGSDTAPAIQTAFERVITPAYLQSNFDSYIHNLQTAYQSGGAVPTLDLTSLIPQAEATGVQFSPQDIANLNKELTIQIASPTTGTVQGTTATTTVAKPSTPGFSGLYRKTSAAKWLLVLATLVTMALVFVTAPYHRLRALGHGFLSATFWIAVYYAFFRVAPGIAIHQLKTAKDFSLSDSVNKLITLAATGVAQRLLYAGIATAAIGAGLWVLSMFMPHFGTNQHKGDDRTPLPVEFHKN